MPSYLALQRQWMLLYAQSHCSPIVSFHCLTLFPILKDKGFLKYVLTCVWFCVINFDT